MINTLLKHGADPYLKNNNLQTPLDRNFHKEENEKLRNLFEQHKKRQYFKNIAEQVSQHPFFSKKRDQENISKEPKNPIRRTLSF